MKRTLLISSNRKKLNQNDNAHMTIMSDTKMWAYIPKHFRKKPNEKISKTENVQIVYVTWIPKVYV